MNVKTTLWIIGSCILLLAIGCKEKSLPAPDGKAIDSLNNQAFLLSTERPEKGRQLADSALKLALQIDYKQGIADAWSRLGLCFAELNSLDTALLLHRKSLQLRKSFAGNHIPVAYGFVNIGALLTRIGMPEKALLHLDSAELIFRAYGDTFNWMKAIHNKAIAYVWIDSFNQALDLFHMEYNMAKSSGNLQRLAASTRSLGIIWSDLGVADSSLKYHRISLSYHHQGGADSASYMNLLVETALTLLKQDEVHEAGQMLQTAQALHHAGIGAPDDAVELALAKLEQQIAVGDKDSIRTALTRYAHLSLVASNQHAIETIAEKEALYQLKDLNNRTALLEAKQARNKFLLGAALLISFLIATIALLYWRNTRNKQKIAEKDLKIKEAQIQELIAANELNSVHAALTGQDGERNRIARELHDRLGHLLALTRLSFSSLEEDIRRVENQHRDNYNRISMMLDEASTEVRRISHDLGGNPGTGFGLTNALQGLAEAVSLNNRISVHFKPFKVPETIPADVQMHLYRVCGELITNTIRHSGADRIDIQLMGKEQDLVFTYEDNGKGFDPALARSGKGLGYSSLANRIHTIQGSWEVDSSPGRGMYFQAEIPLLVM